MSTAWGSRWGQSRRNRLAYLTMLRRSSAYNLRSTAVRAVAVTGVGTAALHSEHWALALALCLPAAACVVLQLVQSHHERAESLPRLWPATALYAEMSHKNGRHTIAVETYMEIVGGLLLVQCAKAWFIDRMVLLFRAMADRDPRYASWEY